MTCGVVVPQGWSVGVFAAVFDTQGRLLISERKDGRGWNLPGGRAENREDHLGELAREVLEETSLICVGPWRFLGKYESAERRDAALLYAIRVKGHMQPSDEASRHIFVDADILRRDVRVVWQEYAGQEIGRTWYMMKDAIREFLTNPAMRSFAHERELV